MNLVVVTPEGEVYNDTVDYVVIKSENDQFAIMNNHIPIVSNIVNGYLKIVKDKKELYVSDINGVVEFSNNNVIVISQEAEIGEDLKSAHDHLQKIKQQRLEENKRRNVDFVSAEHELQKNIKEIKARDLK